MKEDFRTLIDNYIKEQEEKLNQKRKDSMLVIFKKFIEEELGYKIMIEEKVGRRKVKLCFYHPYDIKFDYKYDLDTCELLDEYKERED